MGILMNGNYWWWVPHDNNDDDYNHTQSMLQAGELQHPVSRVFQPSQRALQLSPILPLLPVVLNLQSLWSAHG